MVLIDLNLSQSLARYSSISCVALETKVQIGLKGRTRTYDCLVPNELLYQLSYFQVLLISLRTYSSSFLIHTHMFLYLTKASYKLLIRITDYGIKVSTSPSKLVLSLDLELYHF